MRQILILLFVLLLFTLTVVAQVPNASFESWTGANPDGWTTSNSPPSITNITKSSVAHSGSSAVRGDVVLIIPSPPVVLQPILQTGTDGKGFPYAQRPAALNGWYQFSPAAASNDQFFVNAILFKGGPNGKSVGAAVGTYSAAAASFKQFSIPFTYVATDTPDTCIIQIQLLGPSGSASPHQGSYFIVDDLALGAVATSVGESSVPTGFRLEQNYPNPFNPSTAIGYQLSEVGHVSLKVFNILGAEVATLVEGEKVAGQYTVNWNASNLPSGVYLYELLISSEKGESYRESKRAILLK
jgi:hypothetical protein